MKKFCLLLISIFVLASCSDDSNSNAEPDLVLLQRVDFFPNTPYEKRWLFNGDGLLEKITSSSGVILQDFVYDSQNRLIRSNLYNGNNLTSTHTFTYDSNDFVTSVNGEIVNFDSTLNAYYVGVLDQYYRFTKLNSEKLLIEGKTVLIKTDETGTYETSWFDVRASYTNNNLTSFSPGESCRYLTHDTNMNPLKNATLAICRAFSFVEDSRWINSQFISLNNVLSNRYCAEDPESELFQYTYNSSNLPITQTTDDYYQGVYENSRTTINYYYEGDVLP